MLFYRAALPLSRSTLNYLAGVIPRSGEARGDLFAIVKTCLDYHGGLQQLLQAIHGFVGESMAVQRLEQTMARLLSRPAPGNAD